MSWPSPTLSSVAIENHTLIGYIDHNKTQGNLAASLAFLKTKRILLPFQRICCTIPKHYCRSFIYIQSNFLRVATSSLERGEPLDALNYPIARTQSGDHLRCVFDHLNSDWSKAWIGLTTNETSETNETSTSFTPP